VSGRGTDIERWDAVTDEEWLAAIPPLMMAHIKQVAPASCRKLRLLAVAWAQFLETQPDYADAKHVSHLGEAVAEGRQTLDFLWDQRQRGWGYDGDWSIANMVLAGDADLDMAVRKGMFFSEDRGQRAGLDVSQRPVMARSLILCVLGNPFRPIEINPSWRTPAVLALANAIYEEQRWKDIPVLGDALEEAGCTDADILGHCRRPGEHARGCWLVDLLLTKE
jgi:hypothetical protein